MAEQSGNPPPQVQPPAQGPKIIPVQPHKVTKSKPENKPKPQRP
jgi:hypothetical protein